MMKGDSTASLTFSKVLVTGARGFVGRHLVPALRNALPATAELFLATSSLEESGAEGSVYLDLTRPETIRCAVETVKADLVIHLAAQASVGQSIPRSQQTWSVNLCGTLFLAREVARCSPSAAFVFVSTAEVYGQSFRFEKATEQTVTRPLTPYARSKVAAEAMLADVLPGIGKLIVLRPSNHCGPGQDSRFVVPSIASQIARIERSGAGSLRVGNIQVYRDFMDVRDVVRGYLSLLARIAELPARSVYNVGYGRTVSVADLIARFSALSASPFDMILSPDLSRENDIPVAAIDSSLFMKDANWRPSFTLEETLSDVLQEQRLLLDLAV